MVIEKDGYTTKYAHMDSLSVSAGQSITKGTVIGTTGNTGSSTGSHLHIECLYNGEYYNPLFYFDVGEGMLYGESPGGGGGAPGNAIPPDSYDDATVQALMEEAAKYLGYPYVWGGSSPSTSFDCSGFVCWVFTNSGVHNLPRTTAQGIYDQCTPVSASEAKAGDIIFFTAENVAGACRNGQALVTSVEKEEKTVSPPKLYDLTTLQRDANRLFGFTAKQTLEYTQSLYEKKMCTYPRTDSQYLSDDMEQTAGNVIEAIFSSILFEENRMFNPDIKRVLNSKKVTDHHAIIPTMEIAKADLAALPETERKILSLVANRLLCATGEKHLYETVKAELSCGGYTFTTSGKSVLKNGWKDFEDAFKRSFKATEEKEQEDKKLPELSEGQTFDGVQTKISEHYTTPPKHFTEDSLLSAMERAGNEDMSDDVERKGLGTPATRADIIEKLVKDGFVKREKKQMLPTEDGMKLITVLPDVVKSSKLTADWENALIGSYRF